MLLKATFIQSPLTQIFIKTRSVIGIQGLESESVKKILILSDPDSDFYRRI